MGDRAYLSIGEVLSLLKDEFPDVTISKIRFLESQGLLDPERTPSGYRKFYADDVARLRWILGQQKDHFLPLRVIKERLDQLGDAAVLDDITVSRRHAEFLRAADGSFTVRDVGSLNGTYLNRTRVETAPLANGDEVQIGKFKLVFFSGSAGEA